MCCICVLYTPFLSCHASGKYHRDYGCLSCHSYHIYFCSTLRQTLHYSPRYCITFFDILFNQLIALENVRNKILAASNWMTIGILIFYPVVSISIGFY
jgi:hypothetical protein